MFKPKKDQVRGTCQVLIMQLYSLSVLLFRCLQWMPTKEGYLRFLIESRAVYLAFEDIMANSPNTTCTLIYVYLRPRDVTEQEVTPFFILQTVNSYQRA